MSEELPGLGAAVAAYRDLLEPFVDGALSADDFQTHFLHRFLSGKYEDVSGEVFAVLDGFFGDVEGYVDDDRLRDPAMYDLGPDELKASAERLLRRAGLRP